MELWKPPKEVRAAIRRGEKKIKAEEERRAEITRERLERRKTAITWGK